MDQQPPVNDGSEERDFYRPNDDGVSTPATPSTQTETQPQTVPVTQQLEPAPAPATSKLLADSVTWTAAEYIAYNKSGSWYLSLAGADVVAALVIWLLTRDLFVVIAVIIGIALVGFYAARQPKELEYTIDTRGVTIGGVFHPFGEFRSFAIIPEGSLLRIDLTPLKRIAMYTSMYVDPNDKDKIISLLSAHLPMEARQDALADNLMRRIRF